MICCVGSRPAHAVPIAIDYINGPNFGFYDDTPVAPIGGNAGTTLGAQRRIVFEAAVSHMASRLPGNQVITVQASFATNFGGDGSGATLGIAGPVSMHRDWTSPAPPLGNTWYGAGAANNLAGRDLNGPGQAELRVNFNMDVDNQVVLGSVDWYYGLNHTPVNGDIDFFSVALHELSHALGFVPNMELSGAYIEGAPGIYDRHLRLGSAANATPFTSMTDAQRASAAVSDNVYFHGPQAISGNGGVAARIYAPTTTRSGSLGHLDSSFGTQSDGDEAMAPGYYKASTQIGPTVLGVLRDVGWSNVTGTVPANPLIVTKTDDSGPGSLRYAVDYASTTAVADTITFDIAGPGPHTITLSSGRINVVSDITIQGPATESVTVQGSGSDRVFYVYGPGTDCTMSNLTITGGVITGTGFFARGGGIFNYFSDLTLNNCTVTGNSANLGGGGILSVHGHLMLNDSTISNNSAHTGAGVNVTSDNESEHIGRSKLTMRNCVVSGNTGTVGGGLIVYTQTGTHSITDSTFSDNIAQSGGGMYFEGGTGDLEIVRSTFSSNGLTTPDSGSGGGLFAIGSVTLTRSTFSNNRSYRGGGIYSGTSGFVLVSLCTFTANNGGGGSNGNGGGIYSAGPASLSVYDSSFHQNTSAFGGGISRSGSTTIQNCTFSANRGHSGGGANFGGADSNVALRSCTFSANTGGSGGGFTMSGNNVSVIDCTLSDNTTTNVGSGIYAGSGNLQVGNTIINNNTIQKPQAIVTSLGYNIHSSTYNATTFTQPTDQNNTNPLLGPLQDNGGPTFTHALLSGSPAIDKGKSSASFDQRGSARIADFAAIANASGGNGSDIGAYELQNNETQTGPTFVVNTESDTDDGFCTINHCSLREAINASNANANANTINFNIPGTSLPRRIFVTTALPAITQPVTINGYSQPGSAPATSSAKAVLNVQVNGIQAGSVPGFTVTGSGTTIRGLNIVYFGYDGVFFSGAGATGNTLEGCYLGTDETGKQRLGNNGGVSIGGGSGNTIGGSTPAARNLIAGYGNKGITLSGANNNIIRGNIIGSDIDGNTSLNSFGAGVLIDAGNNNTISSNLIAFNSDEGIRVQSGSGNRLGGNAIHSNGKLGINLMNAGDPASGVTANDASDGDTGANGLLNYPQLINSTPGGGDFIYLEGTYHGAPNGTFDLTFYAGADADPSGFGEGARYIGTQTVQTDSNGNVRFSTFVIASVPLGQYVTALATDAAGNTSEFSAPVIHASGQAGPNFVVNTTADSDGACTTEECSLREAIRAANTDNVASTISFNIPTSDPGFAGGYYTIRPGRDMYEISRAVTIDGTTQPGYAGAPIIRLKGDITQSFAPALMLYTDGSTLRALSIVSYPSHAVTISGNGNTITGCSIGMDSTGNVELGNGGAAIYIESSNNIIGGTGPGEGNTLVRNEIAGVMVGAGTGNRIRGNVIWGSGRMGIELGNDDVTDNDADDSDSGPNNRQNFPVVGSVNGGSQTIVGGTLQSTPDTAFNIDFYSTDAPNSGQAEGKTYLGSTAVTTDNSGSATFNVTLIRATAAGHFVTATATRTTASSSTGALGDTSEFSAAVAVAATYSISGRIANSQGAAIEGVSVSRGAGSTPVLTNGAGYYTLTNVPAGTHTITPTKSNYTFAPVSRSVTVTNANVGVQNFIGTTGFSISGRISNSAGVQIGGVTITRTGSATPVVSNSAGYYTFIGVQPGTYTLTASRNGYRFTPESKVVSVTTANVGGHNFIGATGYNIVGRIANRSGIGQAGISVRRSGSNVAVTTNSAGYYTFTDVPNGSVTITPAGTGLSFSPESRTVTMNGADIAGQNFISAPGFNVIGRITTSAGAAVVGATVTRSGSSVTAVTNSAGYFVFSGVAAGSYTLTPSLNGYSFTPATKTVTVTSADASGQNFIGTSN